ncbi:MULTISPECIES: hypothetical protein [Candidatus Ichthyocystis]|uniref:hypothetical protein n=1 Tax=Candidatus Ichthyocystis TaxID=2929841 RepID=UPI000B811312|nr:MULTISPECIES: hypothetical protein [Ichthyocystis]
MENINGEKCVSGNIVLKEDICAISAILCEIKRTGMYSDYDHYNVIKNAFNYSLKMLKARGKEPHKRFNLSHPLVLPARAYWGIE